ncbi:MULTISPECIES: hypothetical protein [unclassified Streptomyces]|uniref:hypothetical protein n=1 Tax=unclassified Streptomyces TaxID=2593676 RepID=UPI00081EF929|nr:MULTISPECIES: hypothetical protein [unclassified Streptomyces]MYZ38091.1 hypothetical protein [Streptomyces sp. SID4917]SCF96220.1 hypothetical protein GA0115259_105733 [Streptomyces sp. MnatMP-M17]
MIREVRQLASVVGRRSAVKYVGLGLLATVLSACGGDEGGSGVAENTVEAFAKGKWKLAAQGSECTLTVSDGKWDLSEATPPPGEKHGPLTRELYGTYAFTGGVLEVSAQEREDNSGPKRGVGTPVPSQVSDSESVTIQWSYDETDQSQVPITWDGKKLTLVFDNHDGPLAIAAERV